MKNSTPFHPIIKVKSPFLHVKKSDQTVSEWLVVGVLHAAWLAFALISFRNAELWFLAFSVAPSLVFLLAGLLRRKVSAAISAAAPVWVVCALALVMLAGPEAALVLPGLLIGPLMLILTGEARRGLGLILTGFAGLLVIALFAATDFLDGRIRLAPETASLLATALLAMVFAQVMMLGLTGRDRRKRSDEGAFELPVLYLEVDREGRILRTLGIPPQGVSGRAVEAGGRIDGLFRDGVSAMQELIHLVPGSRAKFEADTVQDGVRLAVLADRPRGGLVTRVMLRRADDRRDLAALAEAARAELGERTAFFAGLGHDLKTPLNAIQGFAELMSTGLLGPISGAYKERARLIHESARDLLMQIEAMLDLAKSEAGSYRLEREPTALLEIGQGVLSQLSDMAARRKVTFDADTGADIWADADPRAVRQIWQNLLSNAIKYSHEGGVVRLGVRHDRAQAVLYVTDDGEGMSEADLREIAQPFTQGRNAHLKPGTGLGLAIVRKLAELHGGTLHIETAPGAGTHVEVCFRLADADAVDAAGSRAAE